MQASLFGVNCKFEGEDIMGIVRDLGEKYLSIIMKILEFQLRTSYILIVRVTLFVSREKVPRKKMLAFFQNLYCGKFSPSP